MSDIMCNVCALPQDFWKYYTDCAKGLCAKQEDLSEPVVPKLDVSDLVQQVFEAKVRIPQRSLSWILKLHLFTCWFKQKRMNHLLSSSELLEQSHTPYLK